MLTWVSMSSGSAAYARSARPDLWPPGSRVWWGDGYQGWVATWSHDQRYLPPHFPWLAKPGFAEAMVLADRVVQESPAPAAWEWVPQ